MNLEDLRLVHGNTASTSLVPSQRAELKMKREFDLAFSPRCWLGIEDVALVVFRGGKHMPSAIIQL